MCKTVEIKEEGSDSNQKKCKCVVDENVDVVNREQRKKETHDDDEILIEAKSEFGISEQMTRWIIPTPRRSKKITRQ